MSLLSYNELCELVTAGVVTNADGTDFDRAQINSASIDVRLGDTIYAEVDSRQMTPIRLAGKGSPAMYKMESRGTSITVHPGQFVLASTLEKFNLPNDIVAEFTLKSSLARAGLEHLHAGYCDPGWSNSTLTLELKNVLQFHAMELQPGMKIGQMKFYRVTEVPHSMSYATVGQYNNQTDATQSKGVR